MRPSQSKKQKSSAKNQSEYYVGMVATAKKALIKLARMNGREPHLSRKNAQ